jgi:hypothetical protein
MLILGVAFTLSLHDLTRSHLIATYDHMYIGTKLDRYKASSAAVSPAPTMHIFTAEEESITHGAGTHTVPIQTLFAFNPNHLAEAP